MLETAGLTMLVEGFNINSIINHRTLRADLLCPSVKSYHVQAGKHNIQS